MEVAAGLDGAVVAGAQPGGLGGRHVDVGGAEPEPRVDALRGDFLAREDGDVGIAGRIDYGAAGDRFAARLRFENDVGDAVAVLAHAHRPAVEAQVDARIEHHTVGLDLELLGVVGDGVADGVGAAAPDEADAAVLLDERRVGRAPFLARGEEAGVAGCEAVDHFLAEPGDHLVPAPVVQGEQEDDEPVAGKPAE